LLQVLFKSGGDDRKVCITTDEFAGCRSELGLTLLIHIATLYFHMFY